MIDPQLLEHSADAISENNRKRGYDDIDIDSVLALSNKRKDLLSRVETLRANANEIASSVKSASEADREKLIHDGKALKEEVKQLEGELSEVEDELKKALNAFPNILDERVPEGGEEDNEELRKVGKAPEFSFEPKDHLEIGEKHGWIDTARAANVAGSRFVYLKGDLVMLEFALIQFALSKLVAKGFVPVMPPHIINKEAMAAMGYLDREGDEEVYELPKDNAVLIGTSEHSIGPMHKDEMLDGTQLPIRYVGFSPCYRREAGSYGKDVRGMIRLHQFDKIEMFSFTKPDQSSDEHELMLSLQEELMQDLEIPYRVIRLAAKDTGAPSAMTYDIETWIPSQNMYRETHSTSNTTEYQTRRLNIRYKDKEGKGYAHALNGTAFAMSRILVAIMENYQQEDGTIIVPKALEPWMGKMCFHLTHSECQHK